MEGRCTNVGNASTQNPSVSIERCLESWNLGSPILMGRARRPLTAKGAKAPPRPENRIREGEVLHLTESDEETRVRGFDFYAAFFARTLERQA